MRALIHRSSGFIVALHEMPPEKLVEFVEAIRPAEPVHLAELVKRRSQGRSCRGLFAITIDDGVGENVRRLAKLFLNKGWPATCYLPTQYIDTHNPMPFQIWWRAKPKLSGVERIAEQIERNWYSQRPDSYVPATMKLARQVLSPSEMRQPEPITWAEVEALSREDLVRFESHGVSHTAMSALTEKELIFEFSSSQRVIAEHTGRPCRHFCYPFGTNESIGSLAPRIARKYYDSAVTMNLGGVEGSDPWMLPRIPLYPTNSVLFARLKILLKARAGAGK